MNERPVEPTARGEPLPEDVAELIRRCLAGCQTSIAELVDQYRDQVFGLCFRMLGHRQDAEDVTQESLIRAVRNLHRWDPQRAFRPWLLAIAGNRCRTLLASRRRRLTTSAEVERLADPTPDRQRERALAEEVARALGELRDDYRRAFELYHAEQLSYVEIAAALDCPVGTAKTWVHRARRELAEHLCRRGVVEELPDAMR